jgi:nitroreductase
MEALDCIKTRRSVRRFTNESIPDKVLHQVLDAVRLAPSWRNTQCWRLIVVKDPETKASLGRLLSQNNPATKGVQEAPILLVLCAQLEISGYTETGLAGNKGDWFMFDAALAAQNLCLAAHDLGLGTVHVGNIKHQEVDELLGLPEGIVSVEIIPLGYPAKIGNPPPRKEISEFVFQDRYGESINI